MAARGGSKVQCRARSRESTKSTPVTPPLLVRAGVAGTLRPVHPSIHVTGYGDLPAELLVVPWARISDVGADQEGQR
jgi:hypothetical protein